MNCWMGEGGIEDWRLQIENYRLQIEDCRLKIADIAPLNNPRSALITKAITIVKSVPQFARFVAQITAVNPTIAPTEMSIPPVTITKVRPSATSAIIAD